MKVLLVGPNLHAARETLRAVGGTAVRQRKFVPSTRIATRIVGEDPNHFDAIICDRVDDDQLADFALHLRDVRHRVVDPERVSSLFVMSDDVKHIDWLIGLGYRRADGEDVEEAVRGALGLNR